MGTGRFITVKLDPFYQEFLRGQFNWYDPVFTFPKGHDLLKRLEYYLTVPPKDFKLDDFGEETFRIEIPRMEHKDPDCYTFLSEQKNKLFANAVRDYYRVIFHAEIGKAIKDGIPKSDMIFCLMDDYNISRDYEDRIIKDFDRYLKSERLRRYRRRNRKILRERVKK
jgi:hypothetical protein